MDDVIKVLHERLQPKGTSHFVRLHMKSTAFFDQSFITTCIDELEKKARQTASGLYQFSQLEVLALQLLKDSADL